MSPPPTIRILSAEDRDEAELIWRGLEASVTDRPLAASWGWTSTWLRHYGDVVPHRFAIGEADGSPCGITLISEDTGSRGPIHLRRLHLGTAAEPPGEGVFVERNGVLADRAPRDRFAAALVAALRDEGGWSELRLDGFCPDHAEPFLRSDRRLAARRAASPWLELAGASGDVESVLALLGSRTRKRLRRYLRALCPIETDWAGGPERALEIFDELCALQERRWASRGQSGALTRSRFRSFHRELISRVTGSVVLFRIRAEGETIACLYNLVDRDDVLAYQAGISANGDNRVSPGLVAHVLCMAACAERGFRRYDFLAGEAQYKRQLTNGGGELVWARAKRPLARILKPGWGHGPP